ncbi:hypothetical protein [Ruegeria lacuscaerulensis]|uniref:hypothetical protein n=1 Tax=Ruegeria lacuscaerulensis TaxID=55218 RepID=UPI00147D794E|nr:hypothetical protein [Ruegeria lacuscaerulensis]
MKQNPAQTLMANAQIAAKNDVGAQTQMVMRPIADQVAVTFVLDRRTGHLLAVSTPGFNGLDKQARAHVVKSIRNLSNTLKKDPAQRGRG